MALPQKVFKSYIYLQLGSKNGDPPGSALVTSSHGDPPGNALVTSSHPAADHKSSVRTQAQNPCDASPLPAVTATLSAHTPIPHRHTIDKDRMKPTSNRIQNGTIPDVNGILRTSLDVNTSAASPVDDMNIRDIHSVNTSSVSLLSDNQKRIPEFITKPCRQFGDEGDKATFWTSFHGNPAPSISWHREGELIPRDDCKHQISNDVNFHYLEIRDLVLSDAGRYTCTIVNRHGQRSASAILQVNKITKSPSATPTAAEFAETLCDRGVDEGDHVELGVTVTGSTPLHITWRHNNTVVPPGHPDFHITTDAGMKYSLVIADVYPEDAGTFTCEARNACGCAITSCYLNVKEQDKMAVRPEFLSKQKSCGFSQGRPLMLAYRVTTFPPLLSIHWEKDGRIILPGHHFTCVDQGDEHRLVIAEPTVNDGGQYTCVVTSNPHGVISHTTTVTVSSEPDEDQGVDQVDFRDVLKQRKQEKAEDDVCHSDDTDIEQHDFRSVLRRHVKTRSRPNFTTTLCDEKVMSGEEVTMRCHVTGVPVPQVTWLRGKKHIKESKYFRMTYADGVACLVIAEAYAEDGGEYTCEAVNSAGTATCCSDLTVQDCCAESDLRSVLTGVQEKTEPPQVHEFDIKDIAILCGKRIHIRARVSGEPQPVITWHKDRELITGKRVRIESKRDMSELTIDTSTMSDCGIYQMKASNSSGKVEKSVVILVGDVPNRPHGTPVVSDITLTSVRLMWNEPEFDGGSSIINYRVEMRTKLGTQWRTVTSNCKTTSYVVQKLEPNATFMFRVSAENKHGISETGDHSEEVTTSDMTSAVNNHVKSESHTTSDTTLLIDNHVKSKPRVTLALGDDVKTESLDQLPFEAKQVTLNKTDKFEDKYDVKEELGKGKFGTVNVCIERASNKRWAAKIIKCREKEKETIRREIHIMNKLRHSKILQLWDAFEESRKIVLVMELISGGELFERVIDDDFELTELDCVLFMRQVCEGIAYMHHNCVLHLDIKPENIICVSAHNNNIKIIDFGLARIYTPGESTRVLLGTPEFIAPEVINFDEIGFTTDMWSVGVLCYVLLSGLSPFLGDSDQDTLLNVTKAEFDFEDEAFTNISLHAKDFINKLLIKKKSNRMLASDCLSHPWLHDTHAERIKRRLSTVNLKHFQTRRKWQKMGNAIRALGRMASVQKLVCAGVVPPDLTCVTRAEECVPE